MFNLGCRGQGEVIPVIEHNLNLASLVRSFILTSSNLLIRSQQKCRATISLSLSFSKLETTSFSIASGNVKKIEELYSRNTRDTYECELFVASCEYRFDLFELIDFQGPLWFSCLVLFASLDRKQRSVRAARAPPRGTEASSKHENDYLPVLRVTPREHCWRTARL